MTSSTASNEEPITGYQVQTVKNVGSGWRTKYGVFADAQEAITNALGLAIYLPATYTVEVYVLDWINTLGHWHWYETDEQLVYSTDGKHIDYRPD